MKNSKEQNIGFLHPGKMGVSLAASAKRSGYNACWVADGRSDNTRKRAEDAGLTQYPSVAELCRNCLVIVSICPPHAAADVAQEVLSVNFDGIYVEANAISPALAQQIGANFEKQNRRYVDASVIGAPAWQPNKTWLHLAGSDAHLIANYFKSGPLETNIISGGIGKASALKMCFAARSKGMIALLSAVIAASEQLGVREDLERQWDRYQPGFSKSTHSSISQTSEKAWRFVGEMDEIATTFSGVGVPVGFHQAAADVYRRLSLFKDSQQSPNIEQLLSALLNQPSITHQSTTSQATNDLENK